MKIRVIALSLFLFGWMAVLSVAESPEPITITLTGDWKIKVELKTGPVDLQVEPAEILTVSGEKYDALPLYNEKGGAYKRGAVLKQIKAQECATAFAIDPNGVVVREKPEKESLTYEKGKDYQLEPVWGGVGRLPEGRIGEKQPVYIDYLYGKMRLDSVVRIKDGTVVLKKGEPDVTLPVPPALADGETRLANVWVKARAEKLTTDMLFPISETKYPESSPVKPSPAQRLIPKTLAKLEAGEKVQILAWGDSVTDAGYLPDPKTERWQEQFVARLRAKYPKATIELTTEAWGGKNSDSYRNEPPGSPKNYKEKVLDRKPDLIVSEFINDSGFHGEALNQRYSKILGELKEIGAEWIILTPHYARADWMGLPREREIDDDPRPYTKSLREFCAANNIALADASKRYGRLWRQGIPYSTWLMNNINHPNKDGMKLFADALMELFE